LPNHSALENLVDSAQSTFPLKAAKRCDKIGTAEIVPNETTFHYEV
jgi:hypothetical protein